MRNRQWIAGLVALALLTSGCGKGDDQLSVDGFCVKILDVQQDGSKAAAALSTPQKDIEKTRETLIDALKGISALLRRAPEDIASDAEKVAKSLDDIIARTEKASTDDLEGPIRSDLINALTGQNPNDKSGRKVADFTRANCL